jgi:hypothetical protein
MERLVLLIELQTRLDRFDEFRFALGAGRFDGLLGGGNGFGKSSGPGRESPRPAMPEVRIMPGRDAGI